MNNMNNKTEIVSIQLLDKTMQIKTTRDQAEELQKAASIFNSKLREIRDRKLAVGNERIALMAGLNLAFELLHAQKQKDLYLESINGRIKDLQNRLNSALAPETQPLF